MEVITELLKIVLLFYDAMSRLWSDSKLCIIRNVLCISLLFKRTNPFHRSEFPFQCGDQAFITFIALRISTSNYFGRIIYSANQQLCLINYQDILHDSNQMFEKDTFGESIFVLIWHSAFERQGVGVMDFQNYET